ncbi:MAG: ARPP-1 family domain-containing protein [Verrucomicrobiales bacterium]
MKNCHLPLRSLLAIAVICASSFGTLYATEPETPVTVSGPFEHKNLAVYLIHGDDKVPANIEIRTLDEAMTSKVTAVKETGSVNSLTIKNSHKTDYVFVLPGDIVKGGKQDRTLPNGFLLTPRSGDIPVDSFCVEQGRWAKRSGESLAQFSGSKKALAGKNMKLASKLSRTQGKVWSNVAKSQTKLSEKVGKDVKSNASASSFQLTLENKDLAKSIAEYTAQINSDANPEVPNAIGMAFAINGEFNSADIFADAELFEKLWPKLLESAATEAVGDFEKEQTNLPSAPKPADLLKTLNQVESDKPVTEKVAGGNQLIRHEKAGSITFDTRGKIEDSEVRIHRNILAVSEAELAEFKKPASNTLNRQLSNQNNRLQVRGEPVPQMKAEPAPKKAKPGILKRIFGNKRDAC